MTRATIEVHHFFSEVPQFGSLRPLPGTAVEKNKTAITGDHSKQDLRYTQKPIYFPILTNNIWSYLLWSPVIPDEKHPMAWVHNKNHAKKNGLFPTILGWLRSSVPFQKKNSQKVLPLPQHASHVTLTSRPS